ncbi:C40 family peptidase [Streptomyces sp. J2-1]|uniref:C40 family peptidase n=1 Tax=Streptomyces corallincola TaxID=2851888 RepID=UPI001C395724|nr:NlpC/P60 family protein [Streptomyces corallincola]MBV2355775.1 C40 family peptidase [Streptomyces corallincola]
MASHRKQRSGPFGPGLRTPVLATAAITSVAVLSQAGPSEAAPADDGGPSLAEIEKKVDEFYRRADDASRQTGAEAERAMRLHERAATAPSAEAAPAPAPARAERSADYFHQSRLMDRLATSVKNRQRARVVPEAGAGSASGSGPSSETGSGAAAGSGAAVAAGPGAVPRDPKSAKAVVQRKLAAARALLAAYSGGGDGHAVVVPVQAPTKAEKAVAFARAQLGKPCVSGASGPGSYDCAGLTQAAWRAAGVALPRAAHDQAHAGTPVPLPDARPGDLVFFHADHDHIGLLTAPDTLIHAPHPGATIREELLTVPVRKVIRPA